MDALHKILTFLTNPLTLGLAGLVGVCVWAWVAGRGESKSGVEIEERRERTLKGEVEGERVKRYFIPIFCTFFVLWIWLWSTPLMTRWIGVPLEREYPPRLAEEYPEADAICLLGGGVSAWGEPAHVEMNASADRVWMAAKMWKAGRAKRMTLSGPGVRVTTVPLLVDFGVETNALVFFEGAKNTEEEAGLIGEMLREKKSKYEVEVEGGEVKCRKRVLLVTSAWHMRRAKWLFEREGMEVIPVACDYAAASMEGNEMSLGDWLTPDAGCLMTNSYLWKEHFAYWCYRVLDLGKRF